MPYWKWIVTLGLLFGFLGLIGYPERASAIPNSCPQYTCKVVALT